MKLISSALLILCLATVGQGQIVNAECPINCTEAGGPVADPTDCHNYYYCLGPNQPTDTSFVCPNGQYFTESLGCANETTPCVNSCGGGGACNITCVMNYEFISDPLNCTKYYTCLPGGPREESCPITAPYFNGVTCGTDNSVCCTSSCTPYCQTLYTQIPDPKDCHNYYFCITLGIPTNTSLTACSQGEVFDYQSGHCSSTAECKTLCATQITSNNVIATTLPTATTESITTSPGACLTSFTCTVAGNFPECSSSCGRNYFSCSSASGQAVLKTCINNLVFNPNPTYPYCVELSKCPFTP